MTKKCKNCKLPIKDHIAVNFSDGQLISGIVAICPTSVFTEKKKPKNKIKPE